MSKLLSASFLALGAMVAMPVAAVEYDHLYIQDTDTPITFTYGVSDSRLKNPNMGNIDRISYTNGSSSFWIATLDSNGNYILDDQGEIWTKLFQTKGNQWFATNDPKLAAGANPYGIGANGKVDSGLAMIDSSFTASSSLIKSIDAYTFEFTPSADAVQLVFKWNSWEMLYSDVLAQYDPSRHNPKGDQGAPRFSILENTDKGLMLGFEDTCSGDWLGKCSGARLGGAGFDYNDLLLSATNVGTTLPPVTPTIPEPETYAMMLAGLGIVGFVARRRRRNKGL